MKGKAVNFSEIIPLLIIQQMGLVGATVATIFVPLLGGPTILQT